ncbi:DoxX family membrane protein [Asticcacaulis sp.]|uniref:DoxX family membrane protein n=1 Tax=Asticcacaulis sp. TaxID=1872648 RepID=UPI002B61B50D|nr:DoxX family membrane protein [Asticcacaulis sp.]HTM79602.1 DoxX family membrane protein [Asticcacaulis sp.]
MISRIRSMVARTLFGIACLIFGLSHFLYADFTAQMVPAFLPFHLPLAYITGAGHAAAGLALISGVLSRLAAVCEAAMMSLFVVLVHIPMVIVTPPADMAQLFWTMLCVACALSGSAWLLTASLKDRPWGLAHR